MIFIMGAELNAALRRYYDARARVMGATSRPHPAGIGAVRQSDAGARR